MADNDALYEVFADDPGSGNLAFVTSQQAETHIGAYPVVVKVDHDRGRALDAPHVLFHAPNGDLPLCGHGSLAAAWAIANRTQRASVTLTTAIGIVEARVDGHTVSLHLPRPMITPLDDIGTSLREALGIPELVRSFLANAGSPKWIIELAPGTLDGVEPDMAALRRVSETAEVQGAYLLECRSGSTYRARAFNPRANDSEDQATGVAVVAACASLGQPITVLQGPPGRPWSRLEARPTTTGIILSGRVTEVHRDNAQPPRGNQP